MSRQTADIFSVYIQGTLRNIFTIMSADALVPNCARQSADTVFTTKLKMIFPPLPPPPNYVCYLEYIDADQMITHL